MQRITLITEIFSSMKISLFKVKNYCICQVERYTEKDAQQQSVRAYLAGADGQSKASARVLPRLSHVVVGALRKLRKESAHALVRDALPRVDHLDHHLLLQNQDGHVRFLLRNA